MNDRKEELPHRDPPKDIPGNDEESLSVPPFQVSSLANPILLKKAVCAEPYANSDGTNLSFGVDIYTSIQKFINENGYLLGFWELLAGVVREAVFSPGAEMHPHPIDFWPVDVYELSEAPLTLIVGT